MNFMAEEWTHLMNNSCNTPALFIRGTKSDYMKDNDKQVIKNVFPNSKMVELDAGHWVHHERPEEFIKVTVDFLNAE